MYGFATENPLKAHPHAGPTPTIERLVNSHRLAYQLPPISFLLTDLYPSIDAWMVHSSRSEYLSFIPQSVDATEPPISVISEVSAASSNSDGFSSSTRVFRLFCLSFHHFDDETARKVLRSSMDTADGFAVLELQDRRLSSLLIMILDFFLVYIVTIFWFWDQPLQLIFTYAVPVLPFVLSFDGFVSCLRTRGFEEVMDLLDKEISINEETEKEGGVNKWAEMGDWRFEGGMCRHTWPVGDMNWVIGRRKGSQP